MSHAAEYDYLFKVSLSQSDSRGADPITASADWRFRRGKIVSFASFRRRHLHRELHLYYRRQCFVYG